MKVKSTHIEISEVREEVNAIESRLTAVYTKTVDLETRQPGKLTHIQAITDPKDLMKNHLKIMVERLECIMAGQHDKIESQQRETVQLQKTLAEMNEDVSKLEKYAEKLGGEKKELLLRLSSVAGTKLVHNNPNIADLSDPNRPTKLAEKYKEMYDSEWTDAYEALDTGKISNEKEICKELLEILFDAEKTCKTIAETQFTAICKTCCSPMDNQVGDEMTPKDLDSTHVRLINDLRKQTSHLAVQSVIKVSVGTESTNIHQNILKYKKKCTEICWFMSLQTPPVILEQIPKEKSKFNRDRYTEYTKKGGQIDFVTWPPLLLHKDGPLLCKGVAQGK